VTTGRNLRIGAVRVAVVDVGSNTVRLLVAERSRRGVRAIRSERAHLGLATDVEREGCISDAGLKAVGSFAERYVSLARRLEARTIDVVVTAPGRQSSNPDELLAVLGRTGERARVLSAEDEGRLAYSGALCGLAKTPESLAVCDIGGGSTQLMVGTGEGSVWFRSLDIGSLRLTERVAPGDPPTPTSLPVLPRKRAPPSTPLRRRSHPSSWRLAEQPGQCGASSGGDWGSASSRASSASLPRSLRRSSPPSTVSTRSGRAP